MAAANAAKSGSATRRRAMRQTNQGRPHLHQDRHDLQIGRAETEELVAQRDQIRLHAAVELAPVKGRGVAVDDLLGHQPVDRLVRRRRTMGEVPGSQSNPDNRAKADDHPAQASERLSRRGPPRRDHVGARVLRRSPPRPVGAIRPVSPLGSTSVMLFDPPCTPGASSVSSWGHRRRGAPGCTIGDPWPASTLVSGTGSPRRQT